MTRLFIRLLTVLALGALLILSATALADEDMWVEGGENRAMPTELHPGIMYHAHATLNNSWTREPGDSNTEWYVIDTNGYDYCIIYFPVGTDEGHHYWLDIFDENGQFLQMSDYLVVNEEFSNAFPINGNSRLYITALAFGDYSNANSLRFSICLESDDRSAHSTHHWEDMPENKRVQKPATCSETGVSAFRRCTLCGYKIFEEVPTIPHQAGDWVIQTEPTCTEAGREVCYCIMCGEPVSERSIPATGHRFSEWAIVNTATYRAAGLRERRCQVCDVVENENYQLPPRDDLIESGDFELQIMSDGSVWLVGYYGAGDAVSLPKTVEGRLLTGITQTAFLNTYDLKKLTIPASVVKIEENVLDGFPDLDLIVERDSYAMRYAKERGIRYTYPDTNDWLNE